MSGGGWWYVREGGGDVWMTSSSPRGLSRFPAPLLYSVQVRGFFRDVAKVLVL